MNKNATESSTDEAYDMVEIGFKDLTHILESLINVPFKIISDQFDKVPLIPRQLPALNLIKIAREKMMVQK